MMGKYWSTSGITAKFRGKIVGILQKKGVALNLNEWDKFVESLVDIDAKVRQLRCKNEQVEPIPPTATKRNLQSAFGGEDEWMCEMFVLWMYAWEG